MQKDDILKQIRNELPEMKKRFGLKSIGLFGSYAKDLQNDESDIDIIVDVEQPLSKNFFGVWDYLENHLKMKIDLTRKGLHLRNKFIETVEKDIIYA